MTLSCNNQFPKRTFGPGIYINEVTIADARDISGETLPFQNQPIDIGIKLTLDIGRDFQPEMVIAGNLKRDDETGEVIGWGSAFVVQELLAKLGYTGQLADDNRMPAEAIQNLIGKTFLRLSYLSGRKQNGGFRYSDWNIIATTEEGAASLFRRFQKSLHRGYPRNYSPGLLDEPSTTENTNGTAEDVF